MAKKMEEEIRVEYGSAWRNRESGRICVVADLHYVGDDLHAVSYHTIAVPEDLLESKYIGSPGTNKVIADKFVDEWVPVPESEADAAMKALSDGLIAALGDAQNSMQKLSLDKPATPMALTDIKEPSEDTGKALGVLAVNVRNQGLFWADSLQEANERIKHGADAIAFSANERVLVASARINQVKPVMEAVASFIFSTNLYTGSNEEIHWVNKGEISTGDEPFVVQQDMRYMDEESLVNGLDGGAEFDDLDVFEKLLADGDPVIDRFAPDKKSVVAFRIRRNEKSRKQAKDLGEAFLRIQEYEADMATFLLVRNGRQFALIFSELEFDDHLFPDEQDNKVLVREWHDRHVNAWAERGKDLDVPRQHVHYDILDKVMHKKNRFYRDILVLLQGHMDRDTGVLHPQGHGTRINLMNPDECARFLTFRYMTNILPEQIGSFHEYVRERSWYANGSRVLNMLSSARYLSTGSFKECDIPGAYNDRGNLVWEPATHYHVDKVRLYNGRHCMMYPTIGWTRKCDEKRKNTRLYLDAVYHGEMLVNLDHINPDILDKFIHSPRERKHYIEILPLLHKTQKLLKPEWDKCRVWANKQGLTSDRDAEKVHDFWLRWGRLPKSAMDIDTVKLAASLDIERLRPAAENAGYECIVVRYVRGGLQVLAIARKDHRCKVSEVNKESMTIGKPETRLFHIEATDEVYGIGKQCVENFAVQYMDDAESEVFRTVLAGNNHHFALDPGTFTPSDVATAIRKALIGKRSIGRYDSGLFIVIAESASDRGCGRVEIKGMRHDLFDIAAKLCKRENLEPSHFMPAGWKSLGDWIDNPKEAMECVVHATFDGKSIKPIPSGCRQSDRAVHNLPLGSMSAEV